MTDLCLTYSTVKVKGYEFLRGTYRGLKLLDKVMKVIEYTLTTIIRNQVGISAMQVGFMPGRGTSDAIFVLQQVHLGKQKDLYLAFIGLEKAFNSMPRKEMWWAMGKRGE